MTIKKNNLGYYEQFPICKYEVIRIPYELINGVYLPKEKPKQKHPKDKKPLAWNCGHCGRYFNDKYQERGEEYTVGNLFHNIPHSKCPGCGECMGCAGNKTKVLEWKEK